MRCEVVAIGTELLLGQIVDTNSSWIGEQLALAGIDVYREIKVGDNLERIVEVLRDALVRSDAVICTGGLGPTQDDLTRQSIAAVMEVDLEFDEDTADLIRSMFGSRARSMSDNNLLQAYRPAGSRFIDEQPGTAPGLVCELTVGGADKVIYAVPGVPWEMKEMISGTVLNDLRRRAGDRSAIHSRTLLTWGQSESGLAESLAERIGELDRSQNPTLAFLASGIDGLKVRITAKAPSEAEARRLVAAEEEQVRQVLGDLIFGADGDSMESVVLDMLAARGLRLAVAESLTGGLIASRLVDHAGASRSFVGGVVAYDPAVKFDLLGVEPGPVVTTECAAAMASGVRRLLGVEVGLGVTGVAGPDASEGRRPGTVCMAVDVEGVVTSVELTLPGRRRQVREFSCISVLNLLRNALIEDGSSEDP